MKLIKETKKTKTFECGRCGERVTFDKPVDVKELSDCVAAEDYLKIWETRKGRKKLKDLQAKLDKRWGDAGYYVKKVRKDTLPR